MKVIPYLILAVVVCVTMAYMPAAQAHPYLVGDNWGDYLAMGQAAQGILDAMMAQYAGCNLWSTSCNGQTAIWTTILGQRGPGWTPVGGYTADHGANRSPGWSNSPTFVRSDYHWAFLEEALKPGACLDGVPPARVQEIRNAFNANKNRVLGTEITVYGVRVRASVLGCSNDHTRNITTSGNINLPISAGTPFCPTVYTVNEAVPSLFGTANGGPLLNEAHPQLRDLLANMTAAYMTIGDSRVTDYWYAFMGRIALTFVRELLPGLLAGIGKENPEKLEDPAFIIAEAMLDALREMNIEPERKNDKAVACQPWGFVDGIDITRSVSGLPVVGSINIRVTIVDSNVCLTIRSFADKFTCASYACLPEYLAVKQTQGDLNGDGRRNLDTWFQSLQNLQEWKVLEGAGGYLDITTQPSGPATPVNYGTPYNMNVLGVSSAAITYQWYAGNSPGTLQPVPGATTRDFAPVIDVYSFGGTNMYKYYRVDLSAFYCGVANTVQSNVIQIQGGNPPGIQIFDQPLGGNFYPGENVNLTVNAGVLAGTGLTYQWQKFNTTTSVWDNLPGKTQAVLALPLITPAEAGQYRVRIFNQVVPSPVYFVTSNAVTVNVAPVIVIDPQPQGAELTIGASHTMTVGAAVTAGALEYRWQRNTGFGFQNLTAWTPAGATSFTTDYTIGSAQIEDAGVYRCQVRNTLAPFGQYQAVSESAVITISSGTVYRVDKNTPIGAVQNGLTWATAFKTIQPAIDAAAAQPGGGEVWVAGGSIMSPVIYNEARTQPWGTASVTGSLIMKSNVRVYGGFEGYRNNTGAKEQYREQRVAHQNRTIIDGANSRFGVAAYHVVVFGSANAPTTNAVLDGFTIRGGNASGLTGDYHTWRGGGIYNWLSSPIIANCRIINNTAAVSGGAIANEAAQIGGTYYAADATLINCIIAGNHAHRAADGGAGPDGGNPLRGGGGIFNNGANPFTRFLTIRDNTLGAYAPSPLDFNQWGVGTGGVLAFAYAASDTSLLNNSILWGNAEGAIQFGRSATSTADFIVDYTNVQGGWAGSGANNSGADPLLNAQSEPQAGSSAINTADPGLPANEFTDIRGVPRPVAARADRGAIEVSNNGPVPVCVATWLDFIVKSTITDLTDVYNATATNASAEAPIWKVQLQSKSFNCNSIPQDTIRVTVTDVLGRTAWCDAEVNVTESQPPIPIANPLFEQVNLLPQGQYTLTEDDIWGIGVTSFDNCYVTSISVVPSLYRCSQAGKDVYATLLVMDNSGNPAAKSIVLKIRDVTPPTAVCGSLTVELNQFGRYGLSQDEIAVLGGRGVPPNADTTTDACGVAWGLATAQISDFNCAHVGLPVPVSVNIYDNHGNMSTCVGEVIVLDLLPPTIHGARPRAFSTYEDDFTLAEALEDIIALDDVCDGDITGAIMVEVFDNEDNPVPFPIPTTFDLGGEFSYDFTLRYTVQDSSGNEASTETVLTLYDLALPEITLLGEAHVLHECSANYLDPGATAWDPATNTNITNLMETVVAVEKDNPGTYSVTYFILLEEYGILVQEQRIVEVIDSIPPVITLVGDELMGIQLGNGFTEPGFTASDACAGDLTGSVVVGGSVDTNTPGEYILTYDVFDGTLDADTKVRRVLVGDLIAFSEHPQGARLYTTDPSHTLGATYVNGLFVSGHEWYRDAVGLGVEAPELEGNSVVLTVNPAAHPLGQFNYRLRVYDELGTHTSNPAAVEVQLPLTAQPLPDIGLTEGDTYGWALGIEGGLGTRQYQWYRVDEETKGLIPVVNGNYPHPVLGPGRYTGATTATLGFSPFTDAMSGQYQVEVTDDFTSITIGPATLINAYGVPAAGAAALIALALAAALGGAAALRKRS